jgi:hypothetical protein
MMARALVVSLLIVLAVAAQTRPIDIQPEVANLDFAAGAPGEMPPGWQLGPSDTPVYAARIAPAALCLNGKQCGTVQAQGTGRHERCFLYQIVDAAPYRGKVLVYRAAARVTGGGLARLVVRVHLEDNSTSFFDNQGDHPITSGEWRPYGITFPVDKEARDIEFGIQLYGEGAVWINSTSMMSPILEAEKAIRAQFKRFNDARDVIDGTAMAALYSEEGEYISIYNNTRLKGRANLAHMWSSVDGKAVRKIESIDVLTPDLAVVRGSAKFENPSLEFDEVFMMVRENGDWMIRVHQAMGQ